MKKLTRIVAAVVDTRNLTLYKEDGDTIMIPQGDIRLRKIVEEATPQLIAQGYADVHIPEMLTDNSYAKFEEQGAGVVKFFRIAKDKLKGLFSAVEVDPVNTDPVPPLSIGAVPVQAAPAALAAVQPATPATLTMADVPTQLISDAADAIEEFGEDELERFAEEQRKKEEVLKDQPPKVQQTMAAINEIMAHAVPVSSDDFHEKGVAVQGNVVEEAGHTDNQRDNESDAEPNTIIAVVEGANGTRVIPGMERIKTQFARAAKLGTTAGVEKFLQRLASVIEKRSHSVEDLLKFMERADTPIADDGSIVIYKILKRKGDRTDGRYVDCHTGKVEQWTGAYVCMDEKLVDHVRNNECSNGLHVARRGYLTGFSGDVCVLAKLAPEDVITVPSYDANKMRVSGYHILVELTDEQFTVVRNNKPITQAKGGGELLALVLAGKHTRRTHEVRITGQKGNGVVVTAIAAACTPTPAEPVIIEPVTPVEPLSNPDNGPADLPTDPLEVVKQVEQVQQAQALSKKDQAKVLYDAWMAAGDADKLACYEALLSFKKSAKKGWDVLGIPDPTEPARTPDLFKKEKVNTPKLFKDERPQPVVDSQPQTKEADVIIPPKEFKAPKVDNRTVANKDFLKVAKAVEEKPAPAKVVKTIKAVTLDGKTTVQVGDGSPRERITKLLAIGLDSKDIASSILAIKKASKKSWEILGVTPEQVTQIMGLKD